MTRRKQMKGNNLTNNLILTDQSGCNAGLMVKMTELYDVLQ